MFLLASLSGFRFGDMMVSLIFLFIFVAIIVGVIVFILKNSKNKQLDRIEEKLDRLLLDKDK
ncbi:hypothetical protein [Oceanobacillus sp. CAU 1775]